MYYEEKVIDYVLCCRTRPDGDWLRVDTPQGNAVNALLLLTDEQRMDVFGHFCTHCGCPDPRCQCWNDE